MNKKIAVLLLVCGMPAMASAQSVSAPALKEGDTWTYVNTLENGPTGWRQTHDALTVQRVTDSHLYISSKPVGAATNGNEMIVGTDWSRAREFDGSEVVVNRPLAFPLSSGKSWNIEYTQPHPNPKVSSATLTIRYKVIGFEDIAVPAGKFHALKIEAEGEWRAQMTASNTVVQTAQTQPGNTTMVTQARNVTPQTAAGHLYKAFWYAPEVGRWVKSVEESYGSNGTRSERATTELESYQRAAP
jgi:hypothetical protein